MNGKICHEAKALMASQLKYLATPSCWLTGAACTTRKYFQILTINNMAVLCV